MAFTYTLKEAFFHMINRKGPVFLHSLPTKYTSSWPGPECWILSKALPLREPKVCHQKICTLRSAIPYDYWLTTLSPKTIQFTTQKTSNGTNSYFVFQPQLFEKVKPLREAGPVDRGRSVFLHQVNYSGFLDANSIIQLSTKEMHHKKWGWHAR